MTPTTMIAEREEGKKDMPRFRSLYEIGKVLNGTFEIAETFPRILGILSHQMGMKRGGILVASPESNTWEIGSAHGLGGEEMKRRKEFFGSGVAEKIIEKGQMAAVAGGGDEIWMYDAKGKAGWKRGSISFFCSPIKLQGSVAAILGVDHFFDESVAVAEDFTFLGEICSQISDAMTTRQVMAQENRVLLEENWGLRKELETLGRSVPKARRKISLTDILEERLSQMIADMKVEPRSNCRLYNDVMFVVERTLLKSALDKTRHVQLKTARFLGINRNTLRRKIKELGIANSEKEKTVTRS
jgi:transcriptional regulator with GAF, ATPase, and Fis domain